MNTGLKTVQKSRIGSNAGSSILKEIAQAKYLYLLVLPGIIYYIVFNYFPIYGITVAFKEFKANLGIIGSPWVGLKNYELVFRDPYFLQATYNTIVISLQRIIFQFPFPIIIALFLNELAIGPYKRILQTVYTFPYFLSWVIVSGILVNFLATDGALNQVAMLIGFEPHNYLADAGIFRPILYITENWKNAGWQSIIYMATIASISEEQYEAATIDGATRFQKMIYITLPSIRSTIVILLILSIGRVMNAGFEQIFNMQNPAVQGVSDILDTYIYRITFQGPADFGFSTAIGLFKSVINFIFLVASDRLAKMAGEKGLF